ncbi:MAG TPA: proton-conducting transporter membrane subunit [Nitrospiraceae bacterium]|jgi:NADH-quinone oxidoreductase subunit L|nr:proton-conducting transporter membrane subunit [Nitrospiraceae bacterium]
MPFTLAFIAIGAPLLASGLITALGALLGERVAKIGIGALAVAAVAAVLTLYQTVHQEPVVLRLPGMPALLAFATPTWLVDRLAAVMMVLITAVSLVIHVYSRRYMRSDPGYVRFFTLLSLLTFVLLSLVTTGNLLWLFICWHAMTWLLRALLSFDDTRPAARQAGRTTLYVHGIGDAALLIGVAWLYAAFGTLDLPDLFQLVEQPSLVPTFRIATDWEISAVTVATLVLVASVMTKSAQFPFHVWLSGTIEAPTPVSAMLHAGIVNAGGFLVNRLAPLYGMAPTTLYLLFIIGALTALIGAATMLTQPSIKRTLVYSTMGQMGYMVMECGLGAFALAIFHLCAHGLFKATLFLNSGSNIHRARIEFKLPGHHPVREASGFSLMTWATGLAVTLVLPLVILLIAHGLVHVPLFEAQGAVIFLFFAWVTSAQAVFSLYRLTEVASWKVSATMLATLAFIGLTYLWAGESFTHFLYPRPGEPAAYFQAAAWPWGLFEVFVALSAVLVVGVWVILYGRAHGLRLLPDWMETIHIRLYVAFLHGLYVEDAVQSLSGSPARLRRCMSETTMTGR